VVRVGDAVERYVDHASGVAEAGLSGLTVAADCAHGAASETTPLALRGLGAEVVEINCEWDGMDINRECGSTHVDVVRMLVLDSGADIGNAHDGDADRVIAVDELGETVDGDMMMAICAADLHERASLPEDTVVCTVMSNMGFEVAMRELGINVIRTKVGDRYVLDGMRLSGAALGGEQSGHIIFAEHSTTGDGLVTALNLLDTMRRTGRPLSELRAVMRRYPQYLENVPVADKARLGTSATIGQGVHAAEQELGDRGRVLVRPSGTEPLVRVMVEAEEEETAREVAQRLSAVVREELS
jgi:phosphoglucosamine mutase